MICGGVTGGVVVDGSLHVGGREERRLDKIRGERIRGDVEAD